jgi:hypothetical protein
MRYIAKYILFVYDKYIKEDWSIINLLGKICLYPFWIIRILLAIVYSILCFPLVLLHMKLEKINIYKLSDKIDNLFFNNKK